MKCEILYLSNVNNKNALKRGILIYLKTNDFVRFKDLYLKGKLPKETIFNFTELDSASEIQKSVHDFYKDVIEIIDEFTAGNPALLPKLTTFLGLIETEFHIEADLTQSASSETDIEIKTQEEYYDKNKNNLDKHINEIYGRGSYDIIKTLEQSFQDSIIGAAYYDIFTSLIVNMTDSVLNKNIEHLKTEFLFTIKLYLDANNIKYNNNPLSILQTFFRHLKSIENVLTILLLENKKLVLEEYKEQKEKLFFNLVTELLTSDKFNNKVVSKLNKYKQKTLAKDLYAGHEFSASYHAVKSFILEYRPDLKHRIEAIETKPINLLSATTAYSMLTQFDNLLVHTLGKQISILPGTFGINIEGKYSYSLDTSHEIKGWQTSEDIGSERHTSKFTKAVLSQIRIFDHNTGEYKNRRLDSTSYIVAARHLLDDIANGNIIINGNADYIKKSANLINYLVTTMHRNPKSKFQKLLQILFDTTPGLNPKPLKTLLSNKKMLTDLDLNTLYSVYMVCFNPNNPNSFYNLERKGFINNQLCASLTQELAAYVDSNITMDYLETSIDPETGEINLKVKKKYFNDAAVYKLRKTINSESNGKALVTRQELQKKYLLEVAHSADKYTRYKVKIGDTVFPTLRIPNGFSAEILTSTTKDIKFEDSSIFDFVAGVNLIDFRNNLFKLDKAELPEEQRALYNMLQFVDDYLGLNILSNLGLQTLLVYQESYPNEGINEMKNYLMPLVQLAMRAAYVNKQYVDADGEILATFLQNDSIYKHYKEHPDSKLFIESFGNVKYVVASFGDKVLNAWCDALSILSNEASKATTKDGQGNAIPNNGVSKLGGNLKYYLHKQNEDPSENTKTNCSSLMFVADPTAIKATYHDLEVRNIHGDSKAIKQFSSSELFFHAIFNKFWGNYNKTGNVVIQPTVYSDKTTFLNWEILSNLLKESDYVSEVIHQYKITLGAFYRGIYQDSIAKLQTIAEEFLKRHIDDPNIPQNLSYQGVLKLCTEQELTDIAFDLNLEVEKDKDYRVRYKTINGEKIEYLTINEILEYNAKAYSDDNLIKNLLEREKYNFLQNLIDNNASFQVVEYYDKYEYYLLKLLNEKASSKNAVITTIKNLFSNSDDRIKYFENWVDAKTGKLILAKLGKRNIFGIGNDFQSNEPGMQLNPLLDKFFYIEGLLSNNLRMSLTGSEINHPDKAFSTLFTKLKKASTVNGYNEVFKTRKITLLEFDINIHPKLVYEQLLNTLLTDEDYQFIKQKIEEADDITDLANLPHPEIQKIYQQTLLKITNVALGTLFKRNVIIPATLQYCQQNLQHGLPPKIKCAVIYDEEAPVHNYRGETKDIDSSDGAARITPFLAIMENLALGSQAVGFIKKPIWHSYDVNGGTAFLAKFATFTMTNEEMNNSTHSSTNLFKLFKLMTNLQWTIPIDLTKPLHLESQISDPLTGEVTELVDSDAYDLWFTNTILEGLRLFYKNKWDEKVEILNFKKSITNEGDVFYYTIERTGNNDPQIVYHLFNNQSEHITFSDTSKQAALNKAKAYYAQHKHNPETKVHTIRSLFELHTSLGSINCVNSEGNVSEFNNKVVVNFMNNIGTRKEDVSKTDPINQENYYQPLKEFHIGYALNNTAVKNGAKNINSKEAWKGDTRLKYFEVDSDGLGMQMNADHDIVNSELTEFSQVIAATSAYGYTYDNCNEIFQGLAKTALEASKHAIDAVNKFLKYSNPQAQSDLYDAIGRLILVEGSIKDKENLTNMIKEQVLKIFNKYKDHQNDSVKIPFSDPNIYSDFCATLASVINKASIKRKHPGSGCVMAPGYNVITYFEVGDKKYSQLEIRKMAKSKLYSELVEYIKTLEGYDTDLDEFNGLAINTLQDLLEIPEVIEYLFLDVKYGSTILSTDDANIFNTAIVQRYLEKLQQELPIQSIDYFLPEDVVRISKPTGKIDIVVLDSMEKYYDFKKRIDLEGATLQLDVTTPRNLKPSLIRWQYEIDIETGDPATDLTPVERRKVLYMNIFDHPVIRNAFLLKGKLDAQYRKAVQEVFDNLEKGFFEMNGKLYKIINGSLENTEAELIISNIYKDVFGVENESLQEILDEGEDYFTNQFKQKLVPPINKIYDLAFLKDDGKHTLISFGEVKDNEYCIENPFENISVNDDNEIYCMRGNKPLFKIGKYVDVNDLDLFIEDNKIKSHSGKKIDQNLYRINGLKIEKRIDYVKRYNLTTKKIHPKTKKSYYTTSTLYKIISARNLAQLFGNQIDAHKQIGSLIANIYQLDFYKFVELNTLNGEKHKQEFKTINGYLTYFIGNRNVNSDHKDFIELLLKQIKENTADGFKTLLDLKLQFYKKAAHEKWISFLDSLKFISSRIPAQTLQSFMAMKCVGWTLNTNNMAYVSHFLTYLLGSDYDIDKAYIMGQSYDDNGVYIKWSPLFDFTDSKTLELSKQLPIPKKVVLELTNEAPDITEYLNILLENLDDNLEPISYQARLENLQILAKVLKIINNNEGKINYTNPKSNKLNQIFNLLNSHILYIIPENFAEAAYKNVASANIYAVSHNLRNRDQSYTAITMKTLSLAAESSPKGEQTATLNMLNPLTKYIMQYQNLVGKNVISIAANGEKVWFNIYYYWTKMLKEGNTKYLQFQTTLTRVNGRSKFSNKDLDELAAQALTKMHIPDLNYSDEKLKQALYDAFQVDLEDENYAYVDLLISQLLSAATDNAKELILAKINSGSNFARMYVYLIMSGYDFNDIVAFMINPTSELISSMADANMFSEEYINNNPTIAIDLAQGKIKSKNFLHGTTKLYYEDADGQLQSRFVSKQSYLINSLLQHPDIDEVLDIIRDKYNLDEETQITDLDLLMLGFILFGLDNQLFNITTLNDSGDTEINSYLQYCLNILYKLKSVASKYSDYDEMLEDAKEFKKIYHLSTEISGVASAWLGLNLGLPTDELGLLKRFEAMRKVITKRESALGIFPNKMFTDSKDPKIIDKTRKYFNKVVDNILNNNSGLLRSNVEEALKTAYEKNLLGTFDVYKYLTDEKYKLAMIEYNHIIKGTVNVLHMMEEIPHYKAILECLKTLAVAKRNLSAKSRLISQLISESESLYLSDLQLRGIIRYVDKLNALNFAKSFQDALVLHEEIEGFNSSFEDIKTSIIDLSSFEGVATFKHWVEHEFLDYLKAHHSNNPLVQHLKIVPDNRREILATDIDLLNPNITNITRQSYDEILRGMADFEQIYLSQTELFTNGTLDNQELTITDIFQLYNILVNINLYGSERLTTAFKSTSRENSILNKYFNFTAALDYMPDFVLDYELLDYYINAAPIISSVLEKYRTDKFIKVNDPVEGYILKKYNPETNSYGVFEMVPPKAGVENNIERLKRLLNFTENSPFEMPFMAKVVSLVNTIDFDEGTEITDELLTLIKNLLIDFSSSGKIIINKLC